MKLSRNETQNFEPQFSSDRVSSLPNRTFSSSTSNALSTRQALVRLRDDIDHEIILMKNEFGKRSFLSWLFESISFKSELSKMRWPSVLFMMAQAVAHFIVAFVLNVDNLAVNWVGFQGFILTALLLLNLTINLWDTKLRFKELLMKSEQIRELVARCSRDNKLLKQWKQYCWKSANAKTLFTPKSPCVHQTLTYRDQSCLNLPDYLLVRGDIIHLFPGDRAPGDCISLKTLDELVKSGHFAQDKSRASGKISLKESEIFLFPSTINQNSDEANGPNGREPLKSINIYDATHTKLKSSNKGADFLMLNTPYLRSLRISLQRSHKRPVNSIEKECFIVSRKYFETYVIPLVFLLSTIVTAIHYGYLDLTDSDQKIKTISISYLLLRPSLTIMPFLPWMFPCFWMVVNAYGSGRLLCCGEAHRKQSKSSKENGGDEFDDQQAAWNLRTPGGGTKLLTPSKFENLLATPTAAGSSDQNKDDHDELYDIQNKIKLTSICSVAFKLVMGQSGHVWRSSSLLQVLGCLTSLCCIDKVGILSWPNPTPEKVFILTKTHSDEHHNRLVPQGRLIHSDANDGSQTQVGASGNQQTLLSLSGETLNNQLRTMMDSYHKGTNDPVSNVQNVPHGSNKHSSPSTYSSHIRPEVLDVSQTFNTYRGNYDQTLSLQHATRLQFDDLNWRRYINNLKPLGLALLMNNCCNKSFGDYFRFYKHISYESILRCNLTPVVKRRCMCSLSKLIGFSQDVVKNFNYINQIGCYKLIDPNLITRGRLVPSMENTTRLKLPFPNMICNIHQDSSTDSYQMFSQGTADIILDSCIEFWDGKQLVPLDEPLKKKVMDFYHRTSLTSYCSAYSYGPMLRLHSLGDHYIELPSENAKLLPQLRNLENEHHENFFRRQLVTMLERRATDEAHLGALSSTMSSQMQLTDSLDSPTGTAEQHLAEHEQKIDPNQSMKCENNVINRRLRRHLSAEDVTSPMNEMQSGRAEQELSRSDGKDSRGKRKLDDVMDEMTDQVFVGMVAMQYQACPDFVGLVEQLEHACIRFVHFSKENELRSRVFSEKMGLESGWNCHISLQSDNDLNRADKSCASFLTAMPIDEDKKDQTLESSKWCSFVPTLRISNILRGSFNDDVEAANRNQGVGQRGSISFDERTLYSWTSLPSLVIQSMNRVIGSHKHSHHHHAKSEHSNGLKVSTFNEPASSSGDDLVQGSEYGDADNDEFGEATESSTKDEGFESLAFDMSNRAKLPKGIENIRPHLETVDNIPLQVSLFTDCTPNLTKEMIEIMQDYGEIVCVIGSSSSRQNTSIFLQANASIAIEPLMPQTCTQVKAKDKDRSKASHKKQDSLHRRHDRRTEKITVRVPQREIEIESEFNTISLAPRPNNPRDRLGIGPVVTEMGNQNKNKSLSRHQGGSSSSGTSRSSDQSSSSSPSSWSRSSSSSDSSSSSAESDINNDEGQTYDLLMDNLEQRHSSKLLEELPEPSSLASKLASLPCSFSYNRKDQVNLYSLIMEARHFTFKMKNTFVCMICFALSISSAQFLASILFLPPMLSSGLTIWLTVVVVPLMSFSLMSTTIDSQVMKIAVGKNLQLKPENITFFVICYLIKFIPSVIVVVLNFGLIIAHSCKLTGFGSSSLGPCWMFTYVQHGNATSADTGDEDLLWSTHLFTAQVSAAFLMVLYFGKYPPRSGRLRD